VILPRVVQTPADVAGHYDELDPFYRGIWGDHVHHGYWATGRETPQEAVEALVELLAARLALAPGERVCDVGCGYGATAEQLATRHGVHVTGLTISRVQADRAGERAARSPRLRVLCRDWLEDGLEDAAFDCVIAVESTEHMADKQRFFDEACRTLRPGGRLAVCAWIAREEPRAWEVERLLEPICREGRLLGLGSEAEYVDMARTAGLKVDRFEDLSARVSRTWTICAGRALGRLLTDRTYRAFLLNPRARNRAFALCLARLLVAYRTGSMRYGLLTAHKPAT
jgi:tocopherol O-methyltransferase